MVDLITEHLDIWTAAQIQKTNGGRGRSKGSNGQSPHGIKKMQDLILELAVRGKLVSQDPNDEPASILLKKIAEEKERLIEEGKIKKQTPLPEIAVDEEPFQVPDKWEWVRLANIGNIFNGNSVSAQIKKDKYTDIDGGLSFIATKDVGYGWDRLSYNNGVSIPLNEPKFKVAHRGAVLICSEGGSAGKKCGITDQDICFGNKLFANELFGNLESSYILANYLSPTFFYQFSEKMTGIIGGISAAKFSQLLVPIPPIAEQHRIVAKVNELIALCDQLEQQQTDSNATQQTIVETLLASLTTAADHAGFAEAWQRIANNFDNLFSTEQSIDQLKQTILQLAIMGKLVPQDPNDEPARILLGKIAKEKTRLIKEGKIKKQKPLPEISKKEQPFELPETWMWVPWVYILALDDAAFKRGPFGSSLKKDMFVSNGYKVYEQYCPINDDCSFERYYITEEKFESMKAFAVKANDYLVSCSGVTLGRITQVPEEFKEGIINQALLRVRINHDYIDKTFFKLLFRSPYFQELIFDNSTGSAIPNVKGVKKLKVMPVPLLPINEQRCIVAKVDELMALCATLKDRLNDAQTTQGQLADAIVEQAVA